MDKWESEPNRKHWVDPATGLDCLIVRNQLGALCGYVGVPVGHPWYATHYADLDARVHGGLTFSASRSGKICHHAPDDAVANEDVWWLGFDCGHAGDLLPHMKDRYGVSLHFDGDEYRDIEYVEGECARLARQVAEASL